MQFDFKKMNNELLATLLPGLMLIMKYAQLHGKTNDSASEYEMDFGLGRKTLRNMQLKVCRAQFI